MLERSTISVCRADCVLPSGDSLCLLVSELSLGGAFIVSMKPPPLGTRIALMLLPEGHPPVGPIDARVIGLRLDPANAKRSGFELMFPDVDDATFEDLAVLVAKFEAPEAQPRLTQRGQAEKRQFPRVTVDLSAHVRCPLGAFVARVKNLSMTGAMLVVDTGDPASPALLSSAMEIELTIVSSSPPESIDVRAEVVRLGAGTGAAGVGVRFLDLDEVEARRLEGLMLQGILMSALGR